MEIKIFMGDLLKSKEDFIMQQCNCVSNTAKGLSAAIFKKYPQSDIYRERGNNKGKPGTIIIKGKVINFLAQFYPGRGKYSNDTQEKRLQWFKECLNHVKDHFSGKDVSIGFPFKIGCGYGGGDWKEYYRVLKDFDKENRNIQLVMYKLEENKSKSGGKRKAGKKRKSEVINRSEKEEKPMKKRKLD